MEGYYDWEFAMHLEGGSGNSIPNFAFAVKECYKHISVLGEGNSQCGRLRKSELWVLCFILEFLSFLPIWLCLVDIKVLWRLE